MQNAAPRLPQRFNFAQHLLELNKARGARSPTAMTTAS